jgi:hypothetical protein
MPTQFFLNGIDAWLLSGIAFGLMVLSMLIGRRISRTKTEEKENNHRVTILSAVYGLLAFLLAFTFSMSGNRFDQRRQAIVAEANAIGTTILRADLYPVDQREAFRKDLQQYLEARIGYYEAKTDLSDVVQRVHEANAYGAKIWERASALSRDTNLYVASMQMIPSINEMLDLSTARRIGEISRVPDSIVTMLFFLSFVSAFFLGYYSTSHGKPDRMLPIVFCALISSVIFITLDLDRPRRGLIQLDTSQQAMIELREMFK